MCSHLYSLYVITNLGSWFYFRPVCLYPTFLMHVCFELEPSGWIVIELDTYSLPLEAT